MGAPSGGFVNVTFTPAAGTVMASPDVVTQIPLPSGTPVRLRMALGTMGGTVYNRWYTVVRNVMDWTEMIDEQHRRYIDMTGSDLWAALNAAPPTPYRTEVYEDAPYAWWPLDDQPGNAGVLPVTMLNAAEGNTNVLNVIASPNGLGPHRLLRHRRDQRDKPRICLRRPGRPRRLHDGADSGWMFGDPQGSPSSFATGNPVTSQPGSAAWQQAGEGGNTGGEGWFLSCNDTGFPPLSGGITVEGWFNFPFFGSTTIRDISNTARVIAQQPYSPLSLITLTTASLPVAILQLDISGHLSLITYNGSTPTSHSIYSASDLRSNSWFMVTATLTATTWRVRVNGGDTADVSGSGVSMTSAWSWIMINGDTGRARRRVHREHRAQRERGRLPHRRLPVHPPVLPGHGPLVGRRSPRSGSCPPRPGSRTTWLTSPPPAAPRPATGSSPSAPTARTPGDSPTRP